MKKPIWVVGMGLADEGSLTPQAREIIQAAQVLIGGKRLLSSWKSYPAEKITIGANIDKIINRLKGREHEAIVVLASGDPGFHSIAGTILKHFSPQEVRILPNVSSLQAAFAKIGLTWDDAVFTSAHAHSLAQVIGWAKRSPKLGILTDQTNTPARIASTLLDAGMPDCRAVVGENLGTADEDIIDTKLSDLVGRDFETLNVMLLIQSQDWRPEPVFSRRSEESYAHRRGLITKADVRALSIARLNIRPTDTVWDIGAGSGAVSIDMAALAWQGKVYAVEKDSENLAFIHENRRKHGTLNLEIIAGVAPEALNGLPQPGAVFMGGSGGKLDEILHFVDKAASGQCRVVSTFVTLENLHRAYAKMQSLGWQAQFSQINIAHSKPIASLTRLEPINPVFILQGNLP